MADFAERLKQARLNTGLTQEQLGFAIEASKSSVSAWENGRETPSFRLLPALRKALGCSLDSLVCGDNFTYENNEENTNQLTARDPQEASLLAEYRGMSSKQRKALLEVLRSPSN